MPKPKFRVITIREETERKLRELKRELEQKTGKPVSFDDILRYIVARAHEMAENLEKEEQAVANQ
jgi:predicted nucleic acid-binding protein